MSTIKELKEEVRKAQEKMVKNGKAATTAYFKEWLEAHPQVNKILMTAYTVYFNDGDACNYHLSDFGVSFSLEAKISIDIKKEYYAERWRITEDGISRTGDYLSAGEEEQEKTEVFFTADSYQYLLPSNTKNNKLFKECTELYQEFSSSEGEQLLLTTFGDHKVIVISREPNINIKTFNWDHD